jgi:hypothetical protein
LLLNLAGDCILGDVSFKLRIEHMDVSLRIEKMLMMSAETLLVELKNHQDIACMITAQVKGETA